MQVLIGTFLVFLIYLICESIIHKRRLNSIPLRICVTGTRGKTTVTRLLASILRENGKRVAAETTGSEAAIILPDSSELPLRRYGIPSIIEQKKLINRAWKLGADCIVSEIMSIQPENHYVESNKILKPGIVVITNTRKDHTEASAFDGLPARPFLQRFPCPSAIFSFSFPILSLFPHRFLRRVGSLVLPLAQWSELFHLQSSRSLIRSARHSPR